MVRFNPQDMEKKTWNTLWDVDVLEQLRLPFNIINKVKTANYTIQYSSLF